MFCIDPLLQNCSSSPKPICPRLKSQLIAPFSFFVKEIFFFSVSREFVVTLLFWADLIRFILKIEKRVYFFCSAEARWSPHNLLRLIAHWRCSVHFLKETNLSWKCFRRETVLCFWLACVIPHTKQSIKSAFLLVDGVRQRNPDQ